MAKRLIHIVIGCLLGLGVVGAFAEEQSVRPGINQHYQNPDFKIWVERFESEGREVYDLRERIVAALGLRHGMHIADIGAGTGLFTKLFSPQVGETGKVYAVDISKVFIDNLTRLVREQGLHNVRTVLNTDKDVGLRAASIDIAFTCDTYHHFEYPQAMLRSIHSALRENGRLIIIDFERIPGKSSQWVLGHVRADKQTVIAEVEQAGFKLIKEEDFLKSNYYMHFRRQ